MHLNKPHVWKLTEFIEKDHKLKLPFLMKDWADFINKTSAILIANSKAVAEQYDLLIGENKCVVHHRYVHVPKKIDPQDNIFTMSNSLKVLCLGSIQEGKRQMDAVKAIILLGEHGINCELVLMGGYDPSSEYFQSIHNVIQNYANIKIAGFKHNRFAYIEQADLLLLTSENEA